jgi:hypothetical protein
MSFPHATLGTHIDGTYNDRSRLAVFCCGESLGAMYLMGLERILRCDGRFDILKKRLINHGRISLFSDNVGDGLLHRMVLVN